MSDDWQWRDSNWNSPSQPGNDDGEQPTITPAWESGPPGPSAGARGQPPAPLAGSGAAYGRQGPATPQFPAPPYQGPPASMSPYAAPLRQVAPPPYAPVPAARAAPRRGILRPRYLLVLIPLVILVCAGAAILVTLFGTPTPANVQEATTPGAQIIGRTIPVGAHPKVVIDRLDGAVHVNTGPDGTVRIQPTDNTYEGDILYQQNGNVITFDLDAKLGGVDVNLTVPSLTDLDLSTSDGDITLDGVSGQISLTTDNGSITATHVTFKGTSKLDDNLGDVTFNGALDPASHDDFENVRGDMGLTFPANGSFHVDVSAFGGEIVSDFPQIVVSGDEAHGDVGKAPRAQVAASTTSRGSIHLYKGPSA